MKNNYIDMISLIERLHRSFLDLVKQELDLMGIRDINNVQSVLLLTIGDARMTVGELLARGFYLGSNLSYNVKKMIQNGYLSQERSSEDRRLFYVQATAKGRELGDRLSQQHRRHVGMLVQDMVRVRDLQTTAVTLRFVERLWQQISDGEESSGQRAA
ncbi:MAG TPA: MarR family transcriptional regulator [Stellaceae bacterium]|jgi:DNA-binding MarR family transcriptional regulator|nr:MarR family transcriptional regulator [Stellaceae bacterium]